MWKDLKGHLESRTVFKNRPTFAAQFWRLFDCMQTSFVSVAWNVINSVTHKEASQGVRLESRSYPT